MAQVTLPVEIWERIIDYVANDAATYYSTHSWRTLTLKSCALTCRAWTYRSIYHLNHIVTFRDGASVSRFKARFPPHDLPCRQVVSKPRSMKKCSWVSSVPIQLNVALPLLTDLTLHHFDFNQAHTQLIPLLSLARSLESVFLADVRFASANQFKRLIDSLRHVNQLVLRDLEFAESILTTRLTSSRKREVPIQSLRIFADPSEDNPSILFQLLSPLAHSITRIAIDDDKLTPRGVLELQKFIAACISLERFVLEIWNSSPDMPLSHIDSLNLSHLSRLTSMAIRYHAIDDGFVQFMPNLSRFIDTVTSRWFMRVDILLTFHDPENISLVSWNSLDNVLGDDKFRALRRVCIMAKSPEDYSWRKGEYRTSPALLPELFFATEETMPLCHSKNLLHFHLT